MRRACSRGFRGVIVFEGFALLVALGSPAGAVDSIEILPPAPTPDDDVTAKIRGFFRDSCGFVEDHTVSMDGSRIDIQIITGRTPGGCADVIVPYEVDVPLGKLASGSYALAATDLEDTARIDFTVGPRRGTWAGLRVGDCNSDGELDIADPVFLLVSLFLGGPAQECRFVCNPNGDGEVDISDAVFLLTYLFVGGQAPYRPTVGCLGPQHCWLEEWLVDCIGHWRCDCGECRPVCDFEGCGDGVCDVAGGETPQTCSRDCKGSGYPPVCDAIGTRSEGWYDAATGTLIRYAFCAECVPECRACGSFSEGWYDSCTGELIAWGNCDCE
jgi:hypothetical protein